MGASVLCPMLSVVFFVRPLASAPPFRRRPLFFAAPIIGTSSIQSINSDGKLSMEFVRCGDDHSSELPANESSICEVVALWNHEESLAETTDGTDPLSVGKSPNSSTKESSLCSAFCSAVHPHIFSSSRLSPS